MVSPSSPDRHGGPDAARAFIEDFSESLTRSGLSRMPSRVFSALLVSESGSMTAAELATTLQTSPASISGAVSYLDQVGLIRRSRELGQRRDIFTVDDDQWFSTFTSETRILRTLIASLQAGVVSVGRKTAPGARLQETVEFFEFLETELASMLDKWKASRSGSPTARS